MPEENFILSKDFIDFEIFALPDENISDFELKNPQELNTLVAIPEAEKQAQLIELLTNILKAAKLNVDQQVHTLALTSDQGFSFIQIQSKIGFEKALLFGIKPTELGINLELQPYQPIPFQGCIFLLVDKLSDIQQDTNKKKALWNALQDIYLQ